MIIKLIIKDLLALLFKHYIQCKMPQKLFIKLSFGHLVRIKLTNKDLLALLFNHYIECKMPNKSFTKLSFSH